MQLRTISIIANATAREAIRSPAFLGLLVLFTVAALAARVVGWVAATGADTITADLVLSLQSAIGVLVAIATGTALVQAEIQNRTLYTVLTRPLPRWTFVVGKFAGLAIALLAGQAAMLVIGLAWLGVTGAPVTWHLLIAGGMTALEVLVMAGIALCWTALTSPLLAAALGLATYLIGHAVATLPELMGHLHGWKQGLAIAAASAVPNLGEFTYRNQAVYAIAPDWSRLGLAVVYAVLWIALLVGLTVIVLRRRQL